MLQYSIYCVITPGRLRIYLWKSADKALEAAGDRSLLSKVG